MTYDKFPLDTIFDKWDILFDSSKNSIKLIQNKLDIPTDMHIIIFAELHLWNGKQNAVKAVHITNASQLIKGYDPRFQIGVSHNGELIMKGYHHDGTNYYYFRALKNPDRYDPPGDNVMTAWLNGKLSYFMADSNLNKLGNTVLKALNKKGVYQKFSVIEFSDYK